MILYWVRFETSGTRSLLNLGMIHEKFLLTIWNSRENFFAISTPAQRETALRNKTIDSVEADNPG